MRKERMAGGWKCWKAMAGRALLEILSWALHKPKVDPAPLARSSQSPKEETCLVPVYSHKVGQRVGLIARSAHVDARTVRVPLTHMLTVWSNEPKTLSLSQHRNVQTKNTNIPSSDNGLYHNDDNHCQDDEYTLEIIIQLFFLR